jgi:hypothetical protein
MYLTACKLRQHHDSVPFGESCLPLTTELGRLVRRVIASRLARMPAAWPTEDRVVALADPSFAAAIARFHDEDGPGLSDLFDDDELAELDLRLLRRLFEIVAVLSPSTARSCLVHSAEPGREAAR